MKVLSGKVRSDIILVSDNFNYGWDYAIPMVNDFCIFSLKSSGDFYKKAWGIFKANSGDYRILKLESLNAPTTPGLLGDLAGIQWYVNSGGKEKDFFGISSTMYVRRPNGQEVQIYPVPTVDTEAATFVNAQNQISNSLLIAYYSCCMTKESTLHMSLLNYTHINHAKVSQVLTKSTHHQEKSKNKKNRWYI